MTTTAAMAIGIEARQSARVSASAISRSSSSLGYYTVARSTRDTGRRSSPHNGSALTGVE